MNSNTEVSSPSQEPQVMYVEGQRNGLAVAALVLGIIAIATAWIPFLNVVSMILAVIGIGLAIGAFIKARKSGRMVMTAIAAALSVFAIIGSMVVNSATVEAIDDAVTEIDEIFDASDDVTVELGELTFDGFSSEAAVTITNISDETGSFWVTIVAESADGTTQLGSTSVIVNDLKPGQTAQETALFLDEIPADAVLSVSEVM